MTNNQKCLLFPILLLLFSATVQASTPKPLDRLMDGNRRFAADLAKAPHRSTADRDIVALEQHPFAVVVSCSDSRVPPEIVFDQGLGDLFVIRTAGQALDAVDIGSIEYAVDHLHASLIVVMGHTQCGAVEAALSGDAFPPHISSVVAAVMPAVEVARRKPGNLLTNSVTENVRRVQKQLITESPILAKAMRHRHLIIAGGIYDLKSGRVALLH